jgi:hypothetical protein
MARVPAAETSSREEKRCPRMVSFNLGSKSNSGGLMSGLYGAWVNTSTRIYSAIWSHPSPGAGVHCHAKWVAHPRASQVGFCAFFWAIFASSDDNTLLSHLFHVELCHDDSLVIIKQSFTLLSSVDVFSLPGLLPFFLSFFGLPVANAPGCTAA